ncbi:MAG: 16S rRNA (cytosine(1402)-N(4))-methyltransferase, partial [Fimbriimonadaceae bacterium]
MATTGVLVDSSVLRRVVRLRSLIAGPLAINKAMKHDPVMVNEILEVLDLKPGSVVVDGTLGLGGHSEAFLGKVSTGGTVLGTDWDETMLASARERLNPIAASLGANLLLKHADFRTISSLLQNLSIKADGCLLDLGLNSAQVDNPERGMSFRDGGPLDMRMDRTQGETAAAMLN